jgi:transcription-repair coupling factor (superfamily II helicase)
MSAREEKTLGEVQSEVEDRYGHPTDEVSNAFAIMAQRMKARDVGIDKLDARGGRINASFRDRTKIPPRVFSIIGRKNREAYLTRESFIWPYSGNPILAVERMLLSFEQAYEQLEADRAALGAT